MKTKITLRWDRQAWMAALAVVCACERPIDERHLPGPEQGLETRTQPAGVAERPAPPPPLSAQGPPRAPLRAASTAPSAATDDALIAAAIRQALSREEDLSYGARTVGIQVEDGAVTLRGRLRDGAEKARVAALVLKTRQVRSVTDKTEIEPFPQN